MPKVLEEYNRERAMGSGLPAGLKIAAIYFGIIGIYGLLTPLLAENPWSPIDDGLSAGFKITSYLIRFTLVLFMVPAAGIFLRRGWARQVALLLIAMQTLATILWGIWGASEVNAPVLPLFCVLPLTLWNGFWFYQIFKKSSKEALTRPNPDVGLIE